MQKWRRGFWVVMSLVAMSALFAPLAAVAAACPMMNGAVGLCEMSARDATSQPLCAECQKTAKADCDDCAGHHQSSGSKSDPAPSVTQIVKSAPFGQFVAHRVLDHGCRCDVQPASPYLQAATETPSHAPNLWVLMPVRSASLVLPPVLQRGFLPLSHAPPRSFSVLPRASRAPPVS